MSSKYICKNIEKLLRHTFIVHIYQCLRGVIVFSVPLDQKFWFHHRMLLVRSKCLPGYFLPESYLPERVGEPEGLVHAVSYVVEQLRLFIAEGF
jgi:hypothetical protein